MSISSLRGSRCVLVLCTGSVAVHIRRVKQSQVQSSNRHTLSLGRTFNEASLATTSEVPFRTTAQIILGITVLTVPRCVA